MVARRVGRAHRLVAGELARLLVGGAGAVDANARLLRFAGVGGEIEFRPFQVLELTAAGARAAFIVEIADQSAQGEDRPGGVEAGGVHGVAVAVDGRPASVAGELVGQRGDLRRRHPALAGVLVQAQAHRRFLQQNEGGFYRHRLAFEVHCPVDSQLRAPHLRRRFELFVGGVDDEKFPLVLPFRLGEEAAVLRMPRLDDDQVAGVGETRLAGGLHRLGGGDGQIVGLIAVVLQNPADHPHRQGEIGAGADRQPARAVAGGDAVAVGQQRRDGDVMHFPFAAGAGQQLGLALEGVARLSGRGAEVDEELAVFEIGFQMRVLLEIGEKCGVAGAHRQPANGGVAAEVLAAEGLQKALHHEILPSLNGGADDPQLVGAGAVFRIVGIDEGREVADGGQAVAKKVARTDSNVLIQGETGVGKELVARLVHDWSPRAEHAFVPVNCGALAEGVLESELFGHEKGAFTGAANRRLGNFELADKGTLMLDEIGTTDHNFQVKLLRVLQDRMIYRVGSATPIPVDVRIIAATNLDLVRAAREEAFRSDLYYRLSVVTLQVPPLRERMEDLPLLVRHFIRKYQQINPRVTDVSEDGLRRLENYAYPGNVRELENIIERAMILEAGDRLGPASLLVGGEENAEGGGESAPPLAIEEAEKELIQRVLQQCNGRKAEAARLLGINKTTLWRKLKRYGMEDEEG